MAYLKYPDIIIPDFISDSKQNASHYSVLQSDISNLQKLPCYIISVLNALMQICLMSTVMSYNVSYISTAPVVQTSTPLDCLAPFMMCCVKLKIKRC